MTRPLTATEYAPPGWPDRLVITPSGNVVFLEFKSYGGKLATLQEHVLDNITSRGVTAFVARLSRDESQLQLEHSNADVALPFSNWSIVSTYLLET